MDDSEGSGGVDGAEGAEGADDTAVMAAGAGGVALGADDRRMLTRVADYQWGPPAGEALFSGDDVAVTHTSSGRPRQVHGPEGRLVTYATDGRFTLGVAGGARLHDALGDGAYRVVVGDESEPFVRDGRNAFAKFVDEADPAIRPGDEVLVVHEEGDLLAVGRAELSGEGMGEFETGMAVFVRDGNDADD
jgi:uncharacterized protein with predicted RNA binding PUA domain